MSRSRTLLVALVTLVTGISGCREPAAGPSLPNAKLAPPAGASAPLAPLEPAPETSSPRAAGASAVTTPPDPILIVADPVVLGYIAEAGLDLGSLLGVPHASSTKALGEARDYRIVRDTIAADIANDRRLDPLAGVGMRFAHRQFDPRWLDGKATFDLIAIVNRLDRHPFAPEHCGEVRVIHRLSYRSETATGVVASRLPMTVNVVYFVDPDVGSDCAAVARSWLRPSNPPQKGTRAEADWFVSNAGPLAPGRRSRWVLKAVEVNFQSVRWPSTVRPSMAGHAEYVLRVFRRVDAPPFLVPAPLENTIDVARLSSDAKAKAAFVGWLRAPEHLRAVDEGTARVPEEFLAKSAVSVSPHGLARGKNAPFSSVFEPSAFAAADLSSFSSVWSVSTIATPKALLRRLDALSCPGCHQSRSIAGFHQLGIERDDDGVDAVEVPMSPHFHADLERRNAYVVALAEGRVPDERRPPAERGAHDDGVGARCGLGDPGFAAWTCAPGLHCTTASEPDVGVCAPAAGPNVGDACEVGPIAKTTNAHRDTARLGVASACADGRPCETNAVGFPDGLCAGSCASLPEGALCGAIPLLDPFNACLATGTSFEQCIARNTRPGALRSCGFHSPCRDDYVCARVSKDGKNQGVCMPPYFLFQLRVDGHPR